MPRRREKKKVSLRGHRRHGHGNVKNRRGSGNRGGRGNAGLKKHKWTYTVKFLPDHFGSKGFVRQSKKDALPTINLWQIENMVNKGELKKDGDYYVFEFKGKVLGTGKINNALKLKCTSISEKAKQKLEAAGGSVEEL
ncbi:MAG: 50S ribosomal protein L15 [Methanobacteriota archaeon]|nr:MAG: 50S ribosomal protein L15 [Euryarchaeota archaeon]